MKLFERGTLQFWNTFVFEFNIQKHFQDEIVSGWLANIVCDISGATFGDALCDNPVLVGQPFPADR